MAHNPALATQSLGRKLSDVETGFATALEAIFATGVHDFTAIAAELSARGIARPSGAGSYWTLETLNAELAALNASLDTSYAEHGIGA